MPTITYNSYTFTSHEKFGYNEDEKEMTLTFEFLIQKTSASALVSECLDAEAKLTEKNKDLTLNFGGTSEFSFSHVGNTGFSARTHLTKTKDKFNTECCRNYEFRITIQLPFTQSGYNARREADFSVSYKPSRQRVVDFKVLYTSTPTGEALTNYNTYGKVWALSILAAIGGTYELISEHTNQEQEQKIINVSLTYQEILTNQSSTGVDDTAIVDPQIHYSVFVEQKAGKGILSYWQATPIVKIAISYSTTLDKTVVLTDLNTAYITKVKPYLIANAFNTLGLSQYKTAGSNNYVVDSETKDIDPTNYKISGRLTIFAFRATQIIELSEVITITDDPSVIYNKIWNGQNYTFNTYSTGAVKTLQRILAITQLGAKPNPPPDLIDELAPAGCKWMKPFPTIEKVYIDTYGVGSAGTASQLKTVDVYFSVFSSKYLAVQSATYAGVNILT